VSGQRKESIVIAVGDRQSEGYDEPALLRLVQLIDSSAPDARVFTRIGVVGYYLRSARAAAAVADIILRAESLRDSDETFATLGIGLAHGPLIADFDAHGRVAPVCIPLGEVSNRASGAVQGAQTYRDTLAELHDSQPI